MHNIDDLKDINAKIRLMQEIAEELVERAEDIPAVERNIVRIKASLKMLELNISDIFE